MQRAARALLVALAVLVFGAAGYVVVHGTAVKDAGTIPSVPVIPTQSSPVSSTSSAAPQKPAVVAFLGDDWTNGKGASSSKTGFVAKLGPALNVRTRTFAANGAGYANAGDNGKTYADLVPAVVKAHPDVVVVTGGRNDRADDGGTAAHEAKTLFARLHRELPHAVVVGVAPWWGDSDLPPELATLGRAVRSAVKGIGGHYLDLSDPIHGHPKDMADATEPNNSGYAAIAKALAAKLRPLLPPA